MLKIKRDLNQQIQQILVLCFVNSEKNVTHLEVVDRVSETLLQVGENYN